MPPTQVYFITPAYSIPIFRLGIIFKYKMCIFHTISTTHVTGETFVIIHWSLNGQLRCFYSDFHTNCSQVSPLPSKPSFSNFIPISLICSGVMTFFLSLVYTKSGNAFTLMWSPEMMLTFLRVLEEQDNLGKRSATGCKPEAWNECRDAVQQVYSYCHLIWFPNRNLYFSLQFF